MTGVEIALGLTALAGVTSAVGTFAAGRAAAKGKAHEAAIFDRNAKLSRHQAATDAEDTRRENRRRLAAIRAAYGSKGFSLSGSAIDVLEDQAAEFELAAQRESFAGEIRALGFTDSAGVSRMESRALRTSATIGLIGGLGQTAAGVAGRGVDLGAF